MISFLSFSFFIFFLLFLLLFSSSSSSIQKNKQTNKQPNCQFFKEMQWSDEQVAEIKALFDICDLDGNGSIGKDVCFLFTLFVFSTLFFFVFFFFFFCFVVKPFHFVDSLLVYLPAGAQGDV